MKKLISLALAAAMVLSMGVASFAALDADEKLDYIDDYPRLKENGAITDKTVSEDSPVPYGDTVYYALYTESGKLVTEKDATTNIRVAKELSLIHIFLVHTPMLEAPAPGTVFLPIFTEQFHIRGLPVDPGRHGGDPVQVDGPAPIPPVRDEIQKGGRLRGAALDVEDISYYWQTITLLSKIK